MKEDFFRGLIIVFIVTGIFSYLCYGVNILLGFLGNRLSVKELLRTGFTPAAGETREGAGEKG